MTEIRHRKTEISNEKIDKSINSSMKKRRKRNEKLIDNYYSNQNQLIRFFNEDQRFLSEQSEPRTDDDERFEDRILAKSCFALNIASLIGNLLASILSGSLSIMSTFVDSSMDIACSCVMNICLSAINSTDSHKYPRGREKLELIGVVLCSVIMAFANVSMIFQSINTILSDSADPHLTFSTILIIIGQTVFKAILMILCYKRGSASSLVIAMDLRNDLITRSLALICGLLGDTFWHLADPLGAIFVCSSITFAWCQNVVDNIPRLVGVTVDGDKLARILNITLKHDSRIKFIDHCLVYHVGQLVQVELHIVLDENLPLKITHDISHDLEKKIGRLDFVEKCFVHVDYNCDGD